jgi:NNP family nitrate/nitrite transporter-like MFS transporter
MMKTRSNTSRYAVVIITVCWIVWLFNRTTINIHQLLLPIIEEDFGITHAQAASLATVTFLALAISALPAGIIVYRFGARRTLIFYSAICALMSFLLSFSDDYLSLLIAFAALGAALGIYLPAGVEMISSWFKAKSRGFALTVHDTAPPLSIAFGALIVASIVFGQADWRMSFQILAALHAAGLILVLVLMYPPSRAEGPKQTEAPHPPTAGIRQVIVEPRALGYLLPFFFNMCCFQGVATLSTLFLVNIHGYDTLDAIIVIGLAHLGGIAGPLAGFLSDRVGRVSVLGLLFAIATIAIALFAVLPAGPLLLLAYVFYSFATMTYFPVAFAHLGDWAPPGHRAAVTGLYVTVGIGLGGGIAPAVLGVVADSIDLRAAMLGGAVMALMGLVSLVVVYRVLSRKAVI